MALERTHIFNGADPEPVEVIDPNLPEDDGSSVMPPNRAPPQQPTPWTSPPARDAAPRRGRTPRAALPETDRDIRLRCVELASSGGIRDPLAIIAAARDLYNFIVGG